jgi:hypothetical protein
LQRLELAHFATALALRDAVVEPVDAVYAHEAFDGLVLRRIDLHLAAVVRGCLVHEVVGLGTQAAGVERRDLDFRKIARNEVEQHHVFGAEAAGEHGGREVVGLVQERPGLMDLRVDGRRIHPLIPCSRT